MYLKRLDIKNFRVFDEEGVSLIFNQGVNAIIGENNSGKSSVIDAIRIAYSTVTYKKDIFFSILGFPLLSGSSGRFPVSFETLLEVFHILFCILLPVSQNNLRSIILSTAVSNIISSRLRTVISFCQIKSTKGTPRRSVP